MQDHRFTTWLNGRGITEAVLTQFEIQVYDHPMIGECIKIPIQNSNFSKYRRDPVSTVTPKYIYDKGGRAALYGADYITDSQRVLITEGELDCLVAWSNNIPAVSSTGGAMTFNEEWIDFIKDKDVTLCFDNDDAGAKGMVRVLKMLPTAKVVFIPERPNIKDLTDYVKHGGDIHELLRTAKTYTSVEEVQEERSKRISVFESVRFHDAYIEEHTKVEIPHSRYVPKDDTEKERANAVPITQLMEFKRNTACCPWHNEKTASLHYYRKTNTVFCFGCRKYGDAIDIYRTIHNATFKEAVQELNKMI